MTNALRNWVLGIFVGVFISLPSFPQPRKLPSPFEYLVLVSVDGALPAYFDFPGLQQIEAFRSGGAWYGGGWVAAFENNTPPGHAQMATGSFPRTNGILGFGWGNPDTGERVQVAHGTPLEEGLMDKIVRGKGVPTLSGLVKAAYPDARTAAVSGSKPYAAAALGVGPTDFILYAERKKKPGAARDFVEGFEVPAAVELAPRALPGKSPGDAFLDRSGLVLSMGAVEAAAYPFALAETLVREYRPRALMINVSETDNFGHATGGMTSPKVMASVMREVDRGLAALVRTYRDLGLYDRTLWILTSDHGMTPGLVTRFNEDVRKAVTGGKGDRIAVPGSYTRTARARETAERMESAALPDVTGVYFREFSAGRWRYRAGPETAARLEPDLDGAYRFILDNYATEYSYTVVAPSRDGVLYEAEGKIRKGAHGELNWINQNIPILLFGPGVRPGFSSDHPARLVDILPTAARLLGIEVPSCDGIVLADALIFPGPGDADRQTEVGIREAPLRDALRASAAGFLDGIIFTGGKK